ncbi:flagellar biosynthetic protein FliO, partial [Devosia sp.]|uniref:flagellar biosynthetic protein FliO n=1 Tax=Devosia sp. TaxID=1871048 RepID=UPI0019EB881E
MDIITAPLGGIMNTLFALGAVIVGIVLLLWLLKLLTGAAGSVTRGRNRRLAVVDSLALDPKRQLLIVRRDNVEHLILVGGPQDMVVETGIAVEEAPAAQPARRPIPMVASRKPAKASPAVATPPITAATPTPPA